MNTELSATSTLYSESFYAEHRHDSLTSAEVVVPWIVELVAPKSVVDVGCGTGAWLLAFRKYGVGDIVGIDGDWVTQNSLEIPLENFRTIDMDHPAALERQFDLVVSLEVAEHLAPASADGFISFLTSLGPLVLFSAAIPDQGGTEHLNEQWPDYWAALFQKYGYRCVDCFRGRFWASSEVAPWYIQNSFFFVREDRLGLYSNLLEREPGLSLGGRSVVHPRVYLAQAKAVARLSDPKASYSIREFAKAFPTLLSRAIRLRLRTLI